MSFQHVSTADLVFDRELKSLYLARVDHPNFGIPEFIHVKSHHTGRSVTYAYDQDVMEENEWFDGELVVYYPTEEVGVNATALIIAHDYHWMS